MPRQCLASSTLHARSTTRHAWNVLLILLVTLFALSGCGRGSPATVDDPAQSRFGENGLDRRTRTRLAADEFRVEFAGLGVKAAMFDGRTAEPFLGRELLKSMREADVVLLGETHDDPVAHRLQTRLVAEALATGSGALSLEMLERPDQPILSRLRAVGARESTIRKALMETSLDRWAAWEQFYLPTVHAALAQDRPVIAANAPRVYARVARLRGYDYLRTLNPEQLADFELPPPDVDFSAYRRRFEEAMENHQAPADDDQDAATRPSREQMRAHQPTTRRSTTRRAATRPADETEPDATPTRDPDSPEAFFDAQLVWDATMADSILTARRRYGKPVVHLVGSFHTDFEGGLTLLLRERNLDVLTVSFVPAAGNRLRPEDLGRADVVIYTGAAREAVEAENAEAATPPTRHTREPDARPTTEPTTRPTTHPAGESKRPVAREPAVLGEGPAAPRTVPTQPATTRSTRPLR